MNTFIIYSLICAHTMLVADASPALGMAGSNSQPSCDVHHQWGCKYITSHMLFLSVVKHLLFLLSFLSAGVVFPSPLFKLFLLVTAFSYISNADKLLSVCLIHRLNVLQLEI